MSHPAPRCGVQYGAAKDKCRCRYSWIPHQVRNDVKHRVVARYDVAVTPHSDAGSSKVPLVGIAFADIPCPSISGYRVKARYDVEHRVEARYDEVTGSSV